MVITEIGGTVGDIESQPFLEAIRQFALDVGKENCLYIHLTLVPYLKAAAELKTKPTQQSVGLLRQIGIQPDILVCRTERSLSNDDRAKIALFCNVPIEAVIEEKDKDFSVYEVPMSLVDHGMDELIVRKLGLKAGPLNLDNWRDLLHRLRNPEHEITHRRGGQVRRTPRRLQVDLRSPRSRGHPPSDAGAHRAHPQRGRRARRRRKLLASVDGILVPGGFGERGIEGKVDAVHFARQRGIPFFGICLGMQCAVAEFARNVLGLERANSTEFDKDTPNPVICLLDEQKTITDKGGTMRLGAQPTRLTPDSKAAGCYGGVDISERHRHRYEFNNVYRQQFADAGMRFAGTSPDGSLVEVVEIPDHPWFVGVQYHPEFKSQPTRSHPLFAGFIGAALKHHVGNGGVGGNRIALAAVAAVSTVSCQQTAEAFANRSILP